MISGQKELAGEKCGWREPGWSVNQHSDKNSKGQGRHEKKRHAEACPGKPKHIGYVLEEGATFLALHTSRR